MSQAQIIDCKATAERLRAEVAAEVAILQAEHGLQPGLAVVLVGDDRGGIDRVTGPRLDHAGDRFAECRPTRYRTGHRHL